MLIGEAVLTSAAFSPRLILLVSDLQAAGYTVWLEGLRLRFDCPESGAEPKHLGALMKRYRDVVEWLPEPRTELEQVSAPPRPSALPRSRPLFAGKTSRTKPLRP